MNSIKAERVFEGLCSTASHEAQKLTTNPVAYYMGYQSLPGSKDPGIFYFDCPICRSTLAVTHQEMSSSIELVLMTASHLREILRGTSSPEPSREEIYGHLGA